MGGGGDPPLALASPMGRVPARLALRSIIGGGVGVAVALTHDELVEQEARRLCREWDMPETAWPDMAKTLSCAARVLGIRLEEFWEAIKDAARLQ